MGGMIPREKRDNVKKNVIKKAKDFGYPACTRVESSNFIDKLVADPDIGGVLREFMSNERIRTYIKDGILNAYAKKLIDLSLTSCTPQNTIKEIYDEDTEIVQELKGKDKGSFVLRAPSGNFYVLSSGTVLKWETALRKALEIIAREPGLVSTNLVPHICLKLALNNGSLTESEKAHILAALQAINVKACFVGNI